MAKMSTISLVLISVLSFAVVYNTIMLTKSPSTRQLIRSSEGEAMKFVRKAAHFNKSEWGPIVRRPWKAFGSKTKRMFHTAMTCNESPYTKWQSRIMYYYYKKHKDGPGSEMGGFTRILHSGKPDNLMDEIPTFVVDPLPPGVDKGYVVLNRPWAFVQWVRQAKIEEEYVWMAEPDHIIMRPIPNLATRKLPAAFHFFYIVPKDNERILRRWYPAERGPITNIDPIGNAPAIIKMKDLRRIAPLWHNISLEFKRDAEIDKKLGWVLDMYSYAVASAVLGYTHILRKDWMIQPPWDKEVGHAYLIHYTYGNDFNLEGHFTPGKVGPWHFDKRDHQGAIPRNLSYPPPGSHPSVFALIERLNEATASIPGWQAGAM